MKLLFLPPKPLLTKKGTVRKRGRGHTPGRLFFADGRELPAVATLSIEAEPEELSFETLGKKAAKCPKYRATRLLLELRNPQVEIVDQAPKRTV